MSTIKQPAIQPAAVVASASYEQMIPLIEAALKGKDSGNARKIESLPFISDQVGSEPGKHPVVLGIIKKQTVLYDPRFELVTNLNFVRDLSLKLQCRAFSALCYRDSQQSEFVLFDKGSVVRHYCGNGGVISANYGHLAGEEQCAERDPYMEVEYLWELVLPKAELKNLELRLIAVEPPPENKDEVQGHPVVLYIGGKAGTDVLNAQIMHADQLAQQQDYKTALTIYEAVLRAYGPYNAANSQTIGRLEEQIKFCKSQIDGWNTDPIKGSD